MNKPLECLLRWLGALGVATLTACSHSPTSDSATSAELYREMGIRYLELGQIQTALERLQRAEELAPRNSKIQDALGVLYEKINLLDKASEHYQRALAFAPDEPSSLNNYGQFLCRNNRFDEGLTQLQKAATLPLNERRWFALANMGLCEKARGNLAIAEKHLRAALAENPNYAPALLELVRLSVERGQWLSARAFLERYGGQAPQTAETLALGIQIERALGNSDMAEQYRQILMERFPSAPATKGTTESAR